MKEFTIFRVGRWRHARAKQNGRFPADRTLPPVVYPILYRGQNAADARRRFLADHSADDVVRWLDLVVWIDNTYDRYGGYILYSGGDKRLLRACFPRRSAEGQYLAGEDPRAEPSSTRARRERRRIVLTLAEQLLDQVAREAAEHEKNPL